MYAIGEINEAFVLKTLKQLIYQKKVDANQSIEYLYLKNSSKQISDFKLKLTEEEKEWIARTPSISFAGNPNWMPYESFDKDRNYTGIVADYLKTIQEISGLSMKPISTNSWSQCIDIAMSGKVKIISGDSADDILNQKFNPVKPYSRNPVVIIMDREQDYVEDLSLIADKKIAIIKDYGYTADIFKTYPNIKFIEVENIQEGLEGVVDGEYDAMLATMALASYTIQEMQLHTLKIVGKTPIVMHLTLFVSKDEPLLYSIVNKALSVITKEQKHQITNRWIKKQICREDEL